jgi:hypothetical protein
MVIPVLGGLASGANIELDCRLKTVKVSSVVVPYYGQFPEFIIGANNVEVQVGEVIDQSFSGIVDGNNQLYGSLKSAQSFRVDNSEDSYHRIYPYLMRVGSPSGNMPYEISEDSGGEPGGASIITGNLAAGSVPTSAGLYLMHNGAQFSLEAGKTYWLSIDAATVGDASNKIWWGRSDAGNALYKRGNAAYYNGAWIQQPSSDLNFNIRYMGSGLGSTCKGSVDYYKKYL